MTIKTFIFNPFQENTYLLYDESKEAIIIDAGCLYKNEEQILQNFIADNNLVLKRVINTHLHLDHQFGNRFLFDTYGIAPEAHADDEILNNTYERQLMVFGIDKAGKAQKLKGYLSDNEIIKFGNSELTAIHCPGHSPGSLVFYSKSENCIFAGDVLFRGSIGRTDLPGGDYSTLIHSITNRLLVLPESTFVYSGHGPCTSIDYEKQHNPFI